MEPGSIKPLSFFTRVDDPTFQKKFISSGKFGEWYFGGKIYRIDSQQANKTPILKKIATDQHAALNTRYDTFKRILCTITFLPAVIALADKAYYRWSHHHQIPSLSSKSSIRAIQSGANDFIENQGSLKELATIIADKMKITDDPEEKKDLAMTLGYQVDKKNYKQKNDSPLVFRISQSIKEGLGGILPKTTESYAQEILEEWARTLNDEEKETFLEKPFGTSAAVLKAILKTSEKTTVEKYPMAEWAHKINYGLTFSTASYWPSLTVEQKRDVIYYTIHRSSIIAKNIIEDVFKIDDQLPSRMAQEKARKISHTWLDEALEADASEVVEILIKYKQNVNEYGNDRTPLHTAVYNNPDAELLKLLLKHGADPTLIDQYSRTPFQTLISLFPHYPKPMQAMANAIIQTSSLLQKHFGNIRSKEYFEKKIETFKQNPKPLFKGVKQPWDGKSREHPLYLVLLTRDEELVKAFRTHDCITDEEERQVYQIMKEKSPK